MKKKRLEEYVVDIQKACAELGWDIGVKGTDGIRGLVAGKSDFVTNVIEQIEDGDDYEIWTYPDVDNDQIH